LKIVVLEQIKTISEVNYGTHYKGVVDSFLASFRLLFYQTSVFKGSGWITLPKIIAASKPIVFVIASIQVFGTGYDQFADSSVTSMES